MVYLSITISYPSTQFEELDGHFVNLGAHLPPKDNSPFLLLLLFSPYPSNCSLFTASKLGFYSFPLLAFVSCIQFPSVFNVYHY